MFSNCQFIIIIIIIIIIICISFKLFIAVCCTVYLRHTSDIAL